MPESANGSIECAGRGDADDLATRVRRRRDAIVARGRARKPDVGAVVDGRADVGARCAEARIQAAVRQQAKHEQVAVRRSRALK